MKNQSELSILVYNILNAKRYSNCRLCHKEIKNEYVRMDDIVCLEMACKVESASYVSLSEALSKLFGKDVEDFSTELPGIEACCTDCVEKALQAIRFIETTKRSFYTLNEVFNNLTETLITNSVEDDYNQNMYINIADLSTNIIILNKERKKRKNLKEEYTFECVKCNEYFRDFFELNAHNLTVHNIHTCEKCYEVFLSHSDLKVHNKTNHIFKCVECSQSWDLEESLHKHQDRVHNIHVCKDCGKSCKGLDRLHMHEAKHANVKYECPKCGKQYTTRDFYVRHVTLCLKNKIDPHPIRSNYKRIYRCEKCEKSYSTPGGLRVHIRFAHENAEPHVCKECGKKFTAPSYLKIHMIKHTGEKNFVCEICKGRFVSKEALLYHTRRHTGEKPYSCKICNERFVNASARAEHIKFKHVGPTLKCEICSKKFVTSLFLRQHISRHHDPSSKLYYGRNMIPPNMPGEQNMRFKVTVDVE